MNPFLFSFVTLCIAQGALANYGQQQQQYGGGYQQRKMSPSPQTYGHQAGYQAPAPMSAYGSSSSSGGGGAGASYEPQQQQQHHHHQSAYQSPSSAQVSTYDERTPAASSSYGKQSSYARQAPTSYQPAAPASYGQQSYAKAAPAPAKYEEPAYPPMPFSWGYDLSDGYGAAQYHKESGDEYGKRVGSYGYTDAYGIYRQVDYVADEHGFRATVKSNEPGVGKEAPASTEWLAYDPPSNYYAGNTGSGYQAAAAPSYGSGKQSAYGGSQASYAAGPSSSSSASSYGQQQSSSYGSPQRSSYKSSSGYQQQQAYASASMSAPSYQRAKAY